MLKKCCPASDAVTWTSHCCIKYCLSIKWDKKNDDWLLGSVIIYLGQGLLSCERNIKCLKL